MRWADPQGMGGVVNAVSALSKTRFNYWAEFAIDVPLGLALIGLAVWRHDLGVATVVPTLVVGLLLFSLVEYVFHRWLMHGPVPLIAEGHQAHHANPLGYDSLPFFLPPVLLLALLGGLDAILPEPDAWLLTGTVALSYGFYGASHYVMHHYRFRTPWVRRWTARHHIHHHHTDTNFGVTSALWDWVFGTRYRRFR